MSDQTITYLPVWTNKQELPFSTVRTINYQLQLYTMVSFKPVRSTSRTKAVVMLEPVQKVEHSPLTTSQNRVVNS